MEGSDAFMRVWSVCLCMCVGLGGLHDGVGVMVPDRFLYRQ